MFSISVIIPCYNGWKYMKKCLDSLENQTVPVDQIIIIDDCSTDSSYLDLLNYVDNTRMNLKVIQNESNCGPGKSREYALSFVTSEYVAFCDCDDWYELTFVESIKKHIEMNCQSDLIIFDNYICYENKEKNRANSVKTLFGASKEEILALYQMSLWRLVVRKSITSGIICPAIYNGEDAAVAPQIIVNADNISVLDKPLYNYFCRSDSVSSKPSPRAYLGLIEAFKTLQTTIPEEYCKQLEFLGIKLICYGAVLNAFKVDIPIKKVKAFIKDFEKQYPSWKKNKYLKTMSRSKKLFLVFVKWHMFQMSFLLSKVHGYLVNR